MAPSALAGDDLPGERRRRMRAEGRALGAGQNEGPMMPPPPPSRGREKLQQGAGGQGIFGNLGEYESRKEELRQERAEEYQRFLKQKAEVDGGRNRVNQRSLAGDLSVADEAKEARERQPARPPHLSEPQQGEGTPKMVQPPANVESPGSGEHDVSPHAHYGQAPQSPQDGPYHAGPTTPGNQARAAIPLGKQEDEEREAERRKKQEYARELEEQMRMQKAAKENNVVQHGGQAPRMEEAAVAPMEQEREKKKEMLVQQEAQHGSYANRVLGAGDGSDVHVKFTNDYGRMSKEELEKKVRQQNEYQAELRKQVEEKQRRKEEEKRRRLEEERKDELRLQREQEQMRKAMEAEHEKEKKKHEVLGDPAEQHQHHAEVSPSKDQEEHGDKGNSHEERKEQNHAETSAPGQPPHGAEERKTNAAGETPFVYLPLALDEQHHIRASKNEHGGDHSVTEEIARLREELQKEQRELIRAMQQQKENFHLLQQRAEVAEEGSRYAVEKVDASVNDYPRGRDDYAPENRNRAQEEENRQFQEPEQGYGKRRDQMQGYQRQNYALAYNAPPPGHDEVPAQSKQEGKNAQILYVGQEGADEPQGAHRPEPNPPPQANATRQSVRENPLPLQRGANHWSTKEPPRTRGGRPMSRAEESLPAESALVYPAGVHGGMDGNKQRENATEPSNARRGDELQAPKEFQKVESSAESHRVPNEQEADEVLVGAPQGEEEVDDDDERPGTVGLDEMMAASEWRLNALSELDGQEKDVNAITRVLNQFDPPSHSTKGGDTGGEEQDLDGKAARRFLKHD